MAENRTPRRFALLVGVDFYYPASSRKSEQGQLLSINNLQGCVHDVNAVRDFLKKDFGLEHPLVLTSSVAEATDAKATEPVESPNDLPTFSNIKRAFNSVQNQAQEGDFFFFHFSGHGARLEPVKGSPLRRTSDPSLLTVDFCRNGPAIRGWQLNEWLKDLNQKKIQVVVVLDSCYSGGSWRVDGRPRTPENWITVPSIPADEEAIQETITEPQNRIAKLETSWSINPEGFTLMAACESHETAAETQAGGAFTQGLVRQLRDQRQPVTYRHLRDQVARIITGQNPVVYGRDRLLFFGNTEPFSNTPFVARVDDGTLYLPVGKAHGVHRTSEFIPLSSPRNLGFSMDDVDDFESSVKLTPELTQALIKDQYQVLPLRWSFGKQLLHVSVDAGLGSNFRGSIRNVLHERVASPIEVIEFDQSIQKPDTNSLRVERWRDNGMVIRAPASLIGHEGPVRGLNLQSHVSDDTAVEIAVYLSHLGRFRNIKSLGEDASCLPKPFDVSIVAESGKTEGPFPQGQWFTYTFNNNGSDELFLTILSLDSGFGVQQVYPSNDLSKEVGVRGSVKPRFQMEIPIELKESGTGKGQAVHRDIIRTIVTKGKRVSWKSLELPNIWNASQVGLGNQTSSGRSPVFEDEFDWWILDKEILTAATESHKTNIGMGNSTSSSNADQAKQRFHSGCQLLRDFYRTDNMDKFDEAVHEIRAAIAMASDGATKQKWCMTLGAVGFDLGQRYSQTGDWKYLEKAIEASRQSALATAIDDEYRAKHFGQLGELLGKKFQFSGTVDMTTLDEAIRVAEKALSCAKIDNPEHAAFLISLSNLLSDRYTRTGVRSNLDTAISLLKETPHARQNEIIISGSLGLRLHDRYQLTRDITDLDDSISMITKALEVGVLTGDTRAVWLNSLGLALQHRFHVSGKVSHLDESIRKTEEALKMIPDRHPGRPRMSMNLAQKLVTRFSSTKEIADIDRAIQIASEVVERTPMGSLDRPKWLGYVGVALDDRFRHTKERADLNKSIAAFKEAAIGTPIASPDRPERLHNLYKGVCSRFRHTREIADINEAIRVKREWISSVAEDLPQRAQGLGDLGYCFMNKFLQDGDTANIDQAITLTKEALQIPQCTAATRRQNMARLSDHLSQRFSFLGDLKDINESLRIAADTLEATPIDDIQRSALHDSLGSGFLLRFRRTGEMADLEDSVRHNRESVLATSSENIHLSGRLSNLGLALAVRFERTGQLSDLSEAVGVSRETVAASMTSNPDDRALFKFNLSSLLSQRFYRSGNIQDINEAIDMARQTTAYRNSKRASRLTMLGQLLYQKFRRTGEADDLKESIQICREALSIMPDDHNDHAVILRHLANALVDSCRYPQIEETDNADEAVRLMEEASRKTASNDPEKALLLYDVARCLKHRFAHTRSSADFHEANRLLLAALQTENGRIVIRIKAGWDFVSASDMKKMDPQEAYSIIKTIIELVPLCVSLGIDTADKQYSLKQVSGSATDAAALVLELGMDAATAVEMLETGRGIIARNLWDMRADISMLSRKDDALATRFVELRNRLDTPDSGQRLSAVTTSIPGTEDPFKADQRHQASSQMTSLLKEIRLLPGLERFLLAATENDLREAAAHGPIVMVNVSQSGCAALIIKPEKITALDLPGLKRRDIHIRVEAGDIDSISTLEWLWDVVVGPVLTALGLTETPAEGSSWPRIWWIPTAALVLFPLHAAGYHFRRDSTTALDRVVSSYSSSVKAIISARQQRSSVENTETPPKVVLLAMPDPPGQPYLRYATSEINEVESICSSMKLSCVRPAATQKEVLAALDTGKIFHFAGHGSSDQENPLQSTLLLNDYRAHPLTVESLLETNLQSTRPFLAYLSACGTSRLPVGGATDESIYLTSALQLAGFRHAIGTLYNVDDAVCVHVAREIYGALRENGLSDEAVSMGLHSCLRSLRDQWVAGQDGPGSSGRRPIFEEEADQPKPFWIPYVHFGV